MLKGEDLITDELKHHIEVLDRKAKAERVAKAEVEDQEHKMKLQRMDREHKLKLQKMDQEHKLVLQKYDDKIRLIREIGRLKIEELRSGIGLIEERGIKQKIGELENELELTRDEIQKMETKLRIELENINETKYQEMKMEAKEETKIKNENETKMKNKEETKITNENETKIDNEEETKIEYENETKIEDENETEMKSDNERKTDTENESKSQFESEMVNRKETESLESDNEKELENLEPVLERSFVMIENADKEINQTEPPTSFEKFNFTDTLPKQIESYTLKAFNDEADWNDVTEPKTMVTHKVPYLNLTKTRPNTLSLALSQLSRIVPKIRHYNKMEKFLHAEYKQRHTDNKNEFDKSAVRDLKNNLERTENRCQMKWSWRRRKRGKVHSSQRRECREHSREH